MAERHAEAERLAMLTFPLNVVASPSCPVDHALTYGFLLEQGTALPHEETSESVAPILIQFVHPDMPGSLAGLKKGDQLLAVNETAMTGMRIEEANQLISRLSKSRIQPLTLVVVRGGQQQVIDLWGTFACHFTVHLVDSSGVNAFADGAHIYLTRGMLWLLRSDEELAWVLAHEIAHNVLAHPQQAKLRALLNQFLSATTGESGDDVSRPDLEMQADYFASYLVAEAGYNIRKAGTFLHWVALMESGGKEEPFVKTHPSTAARIAAFDRTVQEIEEMQQRGELRPVELRREQGAAFEGTHRH